MSKQPTKEEQSKFEKKFLELYELGLSTTEICNRLGVKRNKGYKFLQKIGKKSHSHLPVVVTQEDINKIKEEYLSGKTIQQISKEMDIKEGTVNYWLRKLEITRPNGKISKCDHDYFENIDTPNKAYFLGLMYADGSILDGKTKFGKDKLTVSIELKSYDGYILEEFRKQTKAESEVKPAKKRETIRIVNGKTYKYTKDNVYFRISCTKMAQDLIKWGCVIRKTTKLEKIPDIPKELIKFFILGFYDGDGIASVGKYSNYMGFCGTLKMMESIAEYLNKELNLPLLKPYYNKFNKIYYLQYNGKERMKILFDYFYTNLEIPHLIRKEEKIKNYLEANTEVN